MKIDIKRFVTGPIETNTYVISHNSACLVVDPSSGCREVLAHVAERSLEVEAVVLTHAHFDHAMGIDEVRKEFPEAGVWVHPAELPLLRRPEYNGSTMLGCPWSFDGATNDLVEPETRIGSFDVGVRHIPGHSPGGVALVLGGDCFPGDVVFAGSIGRSDFPGGDYDTLIAGIKEKILALPDESVLWPGHGNRTTVGRERRANPFLR